jgi:hypothetical protein
MSGRLFQLNPQVNEKINENELNTSLFDTCSLVTAVIVAL